MNRCTARIFSALVVAFAGVTANAHAAAPTYTFEGAHITFPTLVEQQGAHAVAIDDPGVRRLLDAVGATITWQPGQRYILVTTSQPATGNFALGDRRYDIGPATFQAAAPPFLLGGHAYLPLDDLLRALGLVRQNDSAIAWQSGDEPQSSPAPSPAERASVRVTDVQAANENGGMRVRITLDGPATYEWHRLRPPDNRVWIDVHNARLGMPPQDGDVRVHQQNPQTVRVALTLPSYETLDIVPDAQGITLSVSPALADQTAPRAGSGTAGTPNASAVAQNSPAPPDRWKFSGRPSPAPTSTYVPANPRLIVIDPGHGGSDIGSCWPTRCENVTRSDNIEKILNLDISKRVRDILVRRGWQVMMTRVDDRDVAVHAQRDSDELQARDDVANANGARLFLSIHTNSFINAGPHGATVYFYKPEDYALAQAINRRIASEVTVKSDGIVKDKLYVLHHADMPAALVETAFLSNPDDRQLLHDPQWRQKMAQAIADAIADFAGAPSSQTSGPPP